MNVSACGKSRKQARASCMDKPWLTFSMPCRMWCIHKALLAGSSRFIIFSVGWYYKLQAERCKAHHFAMRCPSSCGSRATDTGARNQFSTHTCWVQHDGEGNTLRRLFLAALLRVRGDTQHTTKRSPTCSSIQRLAFH